MQGVQKKGIKNPLSIYKSLFLIMQIQMHGRNASNVVLYYSHLKAQYLLKQLIVTKLLLSFLPSRKCSSQRSLGKFSHKTCLSRKTNHCIHILLPGDPSEEQGCNRGSDAIGRSAEKSTAAWDGPAASQAAPSYLTFF